MGRGKPTEKILMLGGLGRKKKLCKWTCWATAFSTHYLWATLSYTIHKNEDCFQEMLLQFGADLRECFDKGIDFHGRTIRLVCIGLKADIETSGQSWEND